MTFAFVESTAKHVEARQNNVKPVNIKSTDVAPVYKDPNSFSAPTKLLSASCESCALYNLCLPISVNKNVFGKLDTIIQRRKPVKQGSHLFRHGDAFHALYVVRTGCLKTYTISPDGQNQITGFYTPGEVLGLDGLNSSYHTNYAKTLENTSICKIPFTELEKLSREIPSLQRHLFSLMAREIEVDQKLIMLINNRSADQRIAAFLLNISDRFKTRRLSGSSFRLPMSRGDIANYLGLAVETVSRVFSKLQTRKILTAENKEVTILDLVALGNLSNNMQ